MPAEWKREGDTTVVTRYQKHRVELHGMYSVENLPAQLFAAMRSYDEWEAEQQPEVP
jgi:hypothetical protein